MTVEVSCSRKATSRYAVIFCVDEGYLPYAMFAAEQLRNNTVRSDFDIVICGQEDLVVPPSLASLNLRIAKINAPEIFSGLYLDERRTEAVYLRLALPSAFSEDYDRILYLDADIFVHGGDLLHLFNLDMQGFSVAAVRDNLQWFKLSRQVPDFERAGLKAEKYLNSGVLLFDVPSFESEGILERCISFGRSDSHPLRQHDQELLNCVIHGNFLELSPIWNWQQPIRSAYYEVMFPVIFTHFIGPVKPWNDATGKIPPRFILPLTGFLSRHFPNSSVPDPMRTGQKSGSSILRLTAKNIIRSVRLRKYLDQFPDHLTARVISHNQ